MNKKVLFYGLLATMALAGCSSSDDVVSVSDEDVTVSDGNPHYLAVSISDVNGGSYNTSTRATFTNGSTTENHVNNVRFYFFNSDGSIAAVKKSGSNFLNYLDWYPTDTDADNQSTEKQGDESYNVEDQTEATLVINTNAGDKLPTKMLAVVNFTTENSSSSLNGSNTVFGSYYNTNLSLTQLRDLTGDYASLANAGQFVMANSVYATNDTHERVSTTTIESSNIIKKTAKESETDAIAQAKGRPVKMYVERNVAKVQVQQGASASVTSATVSIDGNSKTVSLYPIKAKSTDGSAEKLTVEGEESEYYFCPQGWNLTATTEKAYISKHLELSWYTDFKVWTTWNDENNHRSYWGENILIDANGSFTDNSGYQYVNKYTDFNKTLGTSVYTNENAASYKEGGARPNPTQVVVAGTIYKKSADNTYSVATIGDYEGTYYSEDGMKTQMYSKVGLYTMKVEGTTKTFTTLDKKYIKFVTSNPNATSQNADARCYVQLDINGTYDSATQKWTITDGENSETVALYTSTGDNATAADAASVSTELSAAGNGLLYKDGRTYYWFKVPHIAVSDKGSVGVVRNHYYVCNINNVIGLGTPVYDPEEIIYPETPVDVDTYIAAKVNILSWKNVEKDINLGE